MKDTIQIVQANLLTPQRHHSLKHLLTNNVTARTDNRGDDTTRTRQARHQAKAIEFSLKMLIVRVVTQDYYIPSAPIKSRNMATLCLLPLQPSRSRPASRLPGSVRRIPQLAV